VYVGVVHAEIIESPGPTRLLGPLKLFPNCNKYQSEVLWKCKCSKGIMYFAIMVLPSVTAISGGSPENNVF